MNYSLAVHLQKLSLAASFCFTLWLGPTGCGDDSSPEELPPAEHTYEARGEVRHVTPGPPVEIGIRHEALPGFVNREGEVVGMEAMLMQFQVNAGVDVGSLSAGDAIAFDFEVRYSGGPMLLVTDVTPLPEGTALSFD